MPRERDEDTSHRRSTPGRPRRLTTSEIVDAAIEIADGSGLEGLSMPKLANALGVGTMTIYGYVDGKQDLHDRMAERVFAGLPVPEGPEWRNRLITFFSEFRDAALAHPALAGLLATGRVTIPTVFELLESLLGDMERQGVPPDEAVRLFYAGLAYTLGFVIWEIPRVRAQDAASYEEQWLSLIAGLDPAEYPTMTAPPTREVAATVASSQQFDWGLERLLG